ncbi:Inner membrane protein ylaC [Yersinia rohdei]|nr:Inner membrane protein ylaC [Yersinia rohdei]
MYLTPYFGTGYMIAFTLFFVLMSAILMMEIKPVFKFEDIGVLDLRVCYNGEWFFSRALSTQAIEEILNSKDISDDFKLRFKNILSNKGEIDFYDVYDLAYLQNKSIKTNNLNENPSLTNTSAIGH